MKFLDPKNPLHKSQIKAQITATLAGEFSSADRDRIAREVEREYERLLVGARIFSHIPSLTAGSVRRLISHYSGTAPVRNIV